MCVRVCVCAGVCACGYVCVGVCVCVWRGGRAVPSRGGGGLLCRVSRN